MDEAKIRTAVKMILEGIGEDPEREGLRDTPQRVANMYMEFFQGLNEDPAEYMKVTFSEDHDEMVLLKDIPLYSMCEHHLLPFIGKAHVAYIPQNGKIVGLSKLARVLETLSRRPQVQERLTSQIAQVIKKDHRSARRAGRDRGRAHVYVVAGCEKAGRHDHYLGGARDIPRVRSYQGGSAVIYQGLSGSTMTGHQEAD